MGWRATFPDWQPAEERGDDAQLLPPMRDGEAARLSDVKVEAKETRPPPRYNEGAFIDAMQSAWRFVADETFRERLKEAEGIGTPATRGEIIGGLKAQVPYRGRQAHCADGLEQNDCNIDCRLLRYRYGRSRE